MLVKSLARELGRSKSKRCRPRRDLWPDKRCPGWYKSGNCLAHRIETRQNAWDIARTVLFLAQSAGYIGGQIIAVDGAAVSSSNHLSNVPVRESPQFRSISTAQSRCCGTPSMPPQVPDS